MQRELIYRIKDFSFNYPFQQNGIGWKGELKINQGDFILLKGNSGSGKTTLLYALKGLIPEQINGTLSGVIEYRGKSVSELSEREKIESGLLFQNPSSQMIHQTVKQELAFGLENLRYEPDTIKDCIIELAKQHGIESLLEREVLSLSGGEKQKVALLSILITNPSILLLDEPTAFLDPQSAEELLNIISKQVENKTVIIVEHNLQYFRPYINRVISIDDNGFLTESGLNNIKWEQEFPQLEQKPGSMKFLSIENLSFGFKQKTLYENLNLNLHKGEIITIIGSNGVGKSTLLRIISGLQKGYNGYVRIQDTDIVRMKRKKLFMEIALLFQNPENHFIYPRVIDEVNGDISLLKMIDLDEQKEQNPFTLSVGEKRRLSLAIVQSMNRSLILLDEPTFGQDYNNKLKLLDIIIEMKRKGHAIIIVSHDMPFVKSISDRVFMLDKKVLQELE